MNEFDEINSKLQLRYVSDLKKPEVEPFERAKIIRKVLNDNKWSIRQFAAEYGFANATVQDWLLFENITEEQYENLKANGVNHTEIYQTLRTRGKGERGRRNMEKLSELDYKLIKITKHVRVNIRKPKFSNQTLQLIQELRSSLDAVEMAIKAKMEK